MLQEKHREVGIKLVATLGEDIAVAALGNEMELSICVRNGLENLASIAGGDVEVAFAVADQDGNLEAARILDGGDV